MNTIFFSLRSKILALFLLLVILTSGIIGYVGYSEAKRHLKDGIEARMSYIADQILDSLLIEILDYYQRASTLANQDVMQEIKNQDTDLRITTSILSYKLDAPLFKEISVFNKQGVVVTSTNKEKMDQKLEGAEINRVLNGESIIVDHHFSGQGSEFAISFYLPVWNRFLNQDCIGGVQFDLDGAKILMLLDEAPVVKEGQNKDGFIVLTNAEGDILFASKFLRERKKLLTEGFHSFRNKDFLNFSPSKDEKVIVRRFASNDFISGEYILTKAFIQRHPALRWSLWVFRSAQDAFSPLREASIKIVFIFLAIVALAIVLSIFFSKKLTHSLRHMVRLVREIISGNLDQRVNVVSQDEVGELATAFNDLTRNLGESKVKIEQAQAQLVHAGKIAAFGQLSAGVAHELNQPLTSVSLWESVAKKALAEKEIEVIRKKVSESLGVIEKNVQRMSAIIRQLRDFSRRSKSQYGEVDLNQIVENVLLMFGQQFQSHNIRLRKELKGKELKGKELKGSLPHLYGDMHQLDQVIVNLIANARDALDEEKGGELTVQTDIDEMGHIILKVSDTGRGMSNDVQRHLFEPFFTTKEAGKGTGLGLWILYGIVSEHGGDIEVKSEKGVGTTFTLKFPSYSSGVETVKLKIQMGLILR